MKYKIILFDNQVITCHSHEPIDETINRVWYTKVKLTKHSKPILIPDILIKEIKEMYL